MSELSSRFAVLRMLLARPDAAEAVLGDGPARARTGAAVEGFVAGLRCFARDPAQARARVEALPAAQRLFAWEGVGLVARLERGLAPLVERWPVEAPLLWIGAGWADAIEGAPPSSASEGWARWWIADGHAFCSALLEGRVRGATARAEGASAELELALDQGRGRGLYFLHGGRARAIAAAVAAAPEHQRPGLWFGVGLASVVTDGLDAASRAQLHDAGGDALVLGVDLAELLLAQTGVTPFDERLRRLERHCASASGPPLTALRAASALLGAWPSR